MIQQSVECKRIGNEYVDLFRKLLQYINYTNFSKDFITDDDLKMLSELEFYISSGKYEIIEFGTKKSPFDVREKLEKLEEKNKTFEDYIKNLNNKLDKLNEEYITLEKDYGTSEIENDKLRKRINKAIEYIRSNYTITDDDLYLALYSSDGTLDKLEKILKEEKINKYYNKDIPTEIHFVYGGRHSGKTYYEFKKLEEENERLKAQLELEEDNRHFLNNKIDKAIKYLNLKVDLDKNHLEEAINDMQEDLLEILKKGE